MRETTDQDGRPNGVMHPKDPIRYVTERSSGSVLVKLTVLELRAAFDIGLMRQLMNLGKNAEHYVHYTSAGLWQHTKGAVGEIAASLYFDRPIYAYSTFGDYDVPDVLPNIQIRCAGNAKSPLYLYKGRKDHPEHPFVLAIWDTDRSLENVTLVGWAYMKDVARPAYWNGEKNEWAIPSAELRPMAELKAFATEQRAIEDLERVARYKAIVSERERARQPPTLPPPPPESTEPNPLEKDF